MNKIILAITISTSSLIVLGLNQSSWASTANSQKKNSSSIVSSCAKLNEEITNLEKDLSLKSKLLARRKQEIEKLPSESTSIKMKLTADTFVTAAESEATQNWIEIKRKEKNRSCAHHRSNWFQVKRRTPNPKNFQPNWQEYRRELNRYLYSPSLAFPNSSSRNNKVTKD